MTNGFIQFHLDLVSDNVHISWIYGGLERFCYASRLPWILTRTDHNCNGSSPKPLHYVWTRSQSPMAMSKSECLDEVETILMELARSSQKTGEHFFTIDGQNYQSRQYWGRKGNGRRHISLSLIYKLYGDYAISIPLPVRSRGFNLRRVSDLYKEVLTMAA